MKPKELLAETSDKEAEELVEILNVLRDVKKGTEFKEGPQTIVPADTNQKMLQGGGNVTIVVKGGKFSHALGLVNCQTEIYPHRLVAKSPEQGKSKIVTLN